MGKKKLIQPDIIILGLGPGDPGLLTRRAWEIINSKTEIFLRTDQHPTVSGFPEGLIIHSFDYLYEGDIPFQEVYQGITAEIINLAKKSPGVVYAVPGDPFIAEATPAMILSQAKLENLSVEIVPGVSFLEPTFAALGMDPLPQLTILDALELQEAHFPPFPPDQPTLIAQLYSNEVASNVKLTLMTTFPDDHSVILIHDAGSDSELVENIPLFELDRSSKIKNRSAVLVPPLDQGTSLESFQEIIAHLRAPDGCPWDREQDHQSLRTNLLEETYESLEAIDANDPIAMQEEFGDLLLQIILHAQIAAEYGEFTMNEVIRGIYLKIVQRHPHVFEDLRLDQPDEVIKNWERIKAEERRTNGELDKGLLDGVPGSLPSLTQAQTYQKRAARMGFDWEDIKDVLDKIPEEILEINDAEVQEDRVREIGDLLFSIVNVARWLKIDAESSLRDANRRFKRRFTFIEKIARAEGRELSEISFEELDKLWERAKLEEDLD